MHSRLLWFLVFLASATVSAQVPPSSPRFRLEQAQLSNAGGEAAGSLYRVHAISSPGDGVGASSSSRFRWQPGLVGYAGTGAVPILLHLGKATQPAPGVELSWSGNETSYDLYRSSDCSSVIASPLTSTSQNQYSDSLAPGLHCYLVTPANAQRGTD